MAMIIDSSAPQIGKSPAVRRLMRLYIGFSQFLSATASLSLSAGDQLKLDVQLLQDLADRTPYWLGIVFVASVSVVTFGHYDLDDKTYIFAWAAGLWASMLAYVPLVRAVRGLPDNVRRKNVLKLHVIWAAWAIGLSLVWLSASWILLPQPSTSAGQFVLASRTFVYLTILGFVFPVLLLSSSRIVVLGMLLGLLGLFYFGLASKMQLPHIPLIVYFYSPIIMYFIIAWFIPHTQFRLRARGIQLETERTRADSERSRASHFIATISHDLRQPLAALALKLDSLKSRASTPEAIADLQSLKQQVDSIEGMVNGSLDLSRLEAGTWRVRIRDVSLAHIIEAVVLDLKPEATTKGLRIDGISLPYIVRTDPQALDRILRNLLGNAIRYTPERAANGEQGKVLLECTDEGAKMRISVLDNGIGIPKEKIDRVFDEYVQLGNPERNRTKGLGLGLSIVKGLAQLLGLGLEVESTEGKGSRFSILVPNVARVPPELRGQAEGDESEPDLSGLTIILVDDDKVPREALKTRLIEWGCCVVDGDSAEDAIAKFRSESDALDLNFIISDFRLANRETGIETIALIRREFGQAIPAAIWSAETSEPKLKAISDAGLEMFSKPPNRKRLIALLKKHRPSQIA